MKLPKIGMLLSGMAVLALCGSIALAEKPEGDRPGKGEKKAQKERGEKAQARRGHAAKALFKDIELSKEQKDQVQTIMKEGADARKQWHEANKEKIESLKAQMKEAHKAKDREKAKEIRTEIRTLMESAPKPADQHDEVRAVLTPEQQTQFDKNVAELKEKREAQMEKRREQAKERAGKRGEGKRDGEGKRNGEGKKNRKGGDKKGQDGEQLDL